MTVLVTGATGFIGQRLVSRLVGRGMRVKVLVREPRCAEVAKRWASAAVGICSGDLAEPETLQGVCDEVATVLHLAGRAHTDDANDELGAAIHRRVTVEGTRALLEEARRAGVQQFVFLSSVKAMGEGGWECLDESAPARPTTPYGQAKREAEELVLEAGARYGMHVTVLRLPLVYGPGVKGNLLRLIEAVDRGRFPPLPEVGNRRSLVHVDDVAQALLLAADKDEAHGKVYIVTDGQTYSTRQIYTLLCRALGKPLPRWVLPAAVLYGAARVGDVLARFLPRPPPLTSAVLDKLLGSACYRSDRIQRELGFRPSRTLADALPEMVEEYRARRGQA